MAHEEKTHWLDRNWYWLLITFGVCCMLALDFCHPSF